MPRIILFAFFPYLKTSEKFHYRGLLLRPSDDLTSVPEDVAEQLIILRGLFYLRDYQRIKSMTCTFWDSDNVNQGIGPDRNYQKLLELGKILTYVYSSPHPTSGDPFLFREHASLYIFSPKKISKYLLYNEHSVELPPEQLKILNNKDIKEIEGYEVILNNQTTFWVNEASRIYPPFPHFWLNISQDLSIDLDLRRSHQDLSSVFTHFQSNKDRNDVDRRILTSLEWYNRSVSIDIPDELEIVFLAIAFESLLGLKQGDRLTERFKDAVILLLGNIPRLDSWLTQFYDARSQIVHEGWSSNLAFLAVNRPEKKFLNTQFEYRSLVSYGRHIFRICLATLLTGSTLANELGIQSMFVTNQERFEKICEKLSKESSSPFESIMGVANIVQDINEYYFVSEKDLSINTMLCASKKIVAVYLKTEHDQKDEVIDLMTQLSSTSRDEHYDALSVIDKLREKIGRNTDIPRGQPYETSTVVMSLLTSVWNYCFMYYYSLERERKNQ